MSTYKPQRIYVRFRGRVLGPFTLDKAIEMARRGQITRQHELSSDGQNWRPGEEFTEVFPRRTGEPQTAEPVVQAAAEPVEDTEIWFVAIDDKQHGPVDEGKIREWIAIGTIQRDTMVWKKGMPEWISSELAKPSWFTNSVRGPVTQTKNKPSESTDHLPVASELFRFGSWILFTGILTTILGALQGVVGFGMLLVLIASSSTKSDVFIEMLLLYLFSMVTGFAILFGGVLLLRYSAAVGALRYQPSKERVQSALMRLSSLWLYSGISLLVWVCCFSFLFLLLFIKGIKIVDILR